MEKFISIPTTTGTNQLISCTNVIGVFAGNAATNTANAANTTILTANNIQVVLTHAAQTAYNMRDLIQSAIATANATSWTNTVYVIASTPIPITAITL